MDDVIADYGPVHRVSVWCDRIAQNALFWSSRLRDGLELAGFDAHLSLPGFSL
jgi:hypothetical protein